MYPHVHEIRASKAQSFVRLAIIIATMVIVQNSYKYFNVCFFLHTLAQGNTVNVLLAMNHRCVRVI